MNGNKHSAHLWRPVIRREVFQRRIICSTWNNTYLSLHLSCYSYWESSSSLLMMMKSPFTVQNAN